MSKDPIIYLLENKEIDTSLLKEIVEEKGYHLKKMSDTNDVLQFIRKCHHQKDYGPAVQTFGELIIVDRNIDNEETRDYFYHLSSTIRWIVAILDNMQVGITFATNKRYVLASRWLIERLGFSTDEAAGKKAGDTFIDEDRKYFRELIKQLTTGKINQFDIQIQLVNRKRELEEYRNLAFRQLIDRQSYAIIYTIPTNNPLLNNRGLTPLMSLIIQEMNKKLVQLIEITAC